MTARNHNLIVKFDLEEMNRLKVLSRAEGFATLSNFVRNRLFQSLSVDLKLNNILSLLQEKNKQGLAKQEKK